MPEIDADFSDAGHIKKVSKCLGDYSPDIGNIVKLTPLNLLHNCKNRNVTRKAHPAHVTPVACYRKSGASATKKGSDYWSNNMNLLVSLAGLEPAVFGL